MARPDAVLFNGGFCTPAVTRERIVEAIAAWFGGAQSGWRPKLLDNEAVESAVARGAAYYGRVRRGSGSRSGSAMLARTTLGCEASDEGLQGICVLPAGVEEGTTLPPLNREFSVLANRPVSFTLYSSRTRHDAHGEVAALDEAEVHRHAPLVSLLRYGKKMRELYLTCASQSQFHRGWHARTLVRSAGYSASLAAAIRTARRRGAGAATRNGELPSGAEPVPSALRLPMRRSNLVRN